MHDPSFVKPCIPFAQGCFEPSLVEISSLVLEEIYESWQCTFTMLLLFPLGNGCGPSLK